MVGNWSGVELALKALPLALKASAMWGQRKSAEKFVKLVKGHIKNADLGLPSKTYSSSDSRPLINDETYLNNVKSWRSKGIYYAGIPAGIIHPSAKMDIAILASILEHGLRSDLPARPLWTMSYQEFGGPKAAQDEVVRAVKNKVAKMG